jgi:acetylornithine/succinyldiaminopimelate/putrescine aminotransferase
MQSTIDSEHAYQVETYRKFPFVVARGEGSYIFTDEGDAYLDMYGGHAVCATGHSHPKIVEAITSQARNLLFYSNLVYLRVRADAAEALIRHAPDGINKVFFVNTGSEANENAIKVARRYTNKSGIISFSGSFHGRTLACLSATGLPKYRQGISPLVPDHFIAEWENLDEVERLFARQEIAAVILEPIQSMGGVRCASAEFLQGLRILCSKYGAVLIYDEIQTGMGRTGSMYYAGRHGVVPDLICLGKAIASGVPMAALLMADPIACTIKYGDLGTTFGGGPLACAALVATVEVLEGENVLENVVLRGNRLKQALAACRGVQEARGEGFLLGIAFAESAQPLQQELLRKKIITGLANDPKVLRLLPPLTLTDDQIANFLQAFVHCTQKETST